MAYDLTLSSPTYNATGKYGQSLNGGTGLLSQTDLWAAVSSTLTVSCWMKTTDASGTVRVILGSNGSFWLGMWSDGKAHARVAQPDTTLSTTVTINDGAWHHLELNIDDTTNTVRFFVDGVLAASATSAFAMDKTNGLGFRYFAGNATFIFTGELDHVALHNTVQHTSGFTPAQVLPSDANLVGLWTLDGNGTNTQGTGATAVTLTGPTSGTVGAASTNFTAGANGAITGTVVVTPSDGGAGGTFTPTTVSISSGTPTATFTYTASSTGAKTISVTNDGGLTNPSNITYTASSSAATAVTMTGPSGGTVGVASTNFTIGANGAITGTVVVTPSDGGGGGSFSPTTVSISSGAPTGTFTYTPASTGAKTISVTNGGGLTNPSNITYTATAAAVTVAVSDANWFFSPYNWDDTGSGKRTNTPGGYCILGFTGTSCVVNFNVSALTGASVPSAEYPRLGYTVDNGAQTYALLTSAGTLSISGLSAGTHTLTLWFDGAHYYPTAHDRWTTPVNAVHITSATLDAGAASAAPTIRSGRLVWFGDSITEGQYTNSSGSLPAANSAYLAAPWMVARALNCEHGQIGFSLQGFSQAGYGNVPALSSAYSLYSAGRSRLSGGVLSPAPDYVVCWHGTNGSPSVSDIQTMVGNFRTIAPTARIFMIVPPGGYVRSNISTAVSNYLAANTSERRVHVIDLGSAEDAGLTNSSGGAPTAKAFDGRHPSGVWHARLASMIQQRIGNICRATTSTRTVSLTLTTDGTTPAASLTGLKWAWYDEATPDRHAVPADSGLAETTDGSGVLTISVRSTLTAGQTGWLIVTNSDGNPATNHSVFAGPVTVS